MLTSQHTHGYERMPQYAIEIGKVLLRSDRPISEEERKDALKRLLRDPIGMLANGEAAVMVGGKFAEA